MAKLYDIREAVYIKDDEAAYKMAEGIKELVARHGGNLVGLDVLDVQAGFKKVDLVEARRLVEEKRSDMEKRRRSPFASAMDEG